MVSSGWIVSDSKDNATATASISAVTGLSHVLDGVIASYKTTPGTPKLLTIKDGNTTIAEFYFTNSIYIPLHGIVCTKGNAVSAVLEASGEAGNIGKVALIGHPR